MKKSQKRSICYIRSTSIINDSRASKEILSLINGGYDVTVLGWDRDNRINDYDNVFINGKRIKSYFFRYKSKYGKSISTIFGLLMFQIWIYKYLKRNKSKYDFIHACDFDCGYISCKIAKKYKKILVYDIYDYYVDSRPMPAILNKIIEKKENNIINFSDVCIICGEWRKEQIAKAFPKKLIVIHNSPDLKFINKNKIIKSNSKRIKVAYVGIFQDNRLLLELLDKFKKDNNYEFHVGGFGVYEEQIKKLSKENENIFYYGSLKYDQVLSLESDCDILFATYNPQIENHKYSAPNKVYEAMALGKPIIVCKDTGVDKLVIENSIGTAINYSAQEFFETLKKYNQDKSIIKKISIYSKKLYNEKYSWNQMEKELLNVYNVLSKEEV